MMSFNVIVGDNRYQSPAIIAMMMATVRDMTLIVGLVRTMVIFARMMIIES